MNSLKQRYEKFGDFMQHNTKGVEVCKIHSVRQSIDNFFEICFLFLFRLVFIPYLVLYLRSPIIKCVRYDFNKLYKNNVHESHKRNSFHLYRLQSLLEQKTYQNILSLKKWYKMAQ